jgi:Asp-tRNA(Asn)/Glu-tRNA(Gln) amidotransferase A subunit family amidase
MSPHAREESRQLEPAGAAQALHLRELIPPGPVLAIPTAPGIAPLINTPADALESFRVRVMRLTCIAGLSGLPQVSILSRSCGLEG